MKTEASQKPVPMDGTLTAALQHGSVQTPYRQPNDGVVRQPKDPWQATLLAGDTAEMLRAAGSRAFGHSGKQIDGHSFRRTFVTLLKGSGEDIKTTQELRGRANSRLTLDVYAQALAPAKRAAHLKGDEMIDQREQQVFLPVPTPEK